MIIINEINVTLFNNINKYIWSFDSGEGTQYSMLRLFFFFSIIVSFLIHIFFFQMSGKYQILIMFFICFDF